MDIKEFSKIVGFSPTTVSHAVSGRGRVNQATRDMIIEKMRELGYTPNVNARRLVTGRSYLVAIVNLAPESMAHIFTMELVRSFLDPLKSRGYDLMLNVTTDNADYEGLCQRVDGHAVDASIVLCEAEAPMDLLRDIARPYNPCVVVTHAKMPPLPHVGYVILDLESGARQVAKLLADQGHRRIGYIGNDVRDLMLGHFCRELECHGLGLPEDRVVIVGEDAEVGACALSRLMSVPNPPTAIFARTDILALGALREAGNLGFKVPDDLSIIGHDDLALVSLMRPALTTLRRDRATLAQRSVEMLVRLMADPGAREPDQIIESTLVMRETVGTPRK